MAETAPAGPAPAPERKERSDAMKLPAQEKAELDARDVSRPFQRKVCMLCGRKFRTCSGGRINCTKCSPPTLGRRMDPTVKDALREAKGAVREAGDLRDATAPADQVLAALDALKEENLRPRNTTEAIALLGKIAEFVAHGQISSLRGRALTGIVNTQIKILERQEARIFREREQKEREHRKNLAIAKREADRRARADKKEAERRARAEEKEKNGGKGGPEVPLPQPSAQDLRIAEGA